MPIFHLSEIVAAAEDRRRADGVLVVAVDGPSGSGKSRLAARIARALGSHALVHTDDLVAGWDALLEVPDQLREVLAPLRAGAPATYQSWDWTAYTPGEMRDVAAAPTVVVEGCESGGLACSDLVDYLVWVDAPRDVRRARAIARDGEAFEPHWERWAAWERELYARDRVRERANLIIDGRMPVRK